MRKRVGVVQTPGYTNNIVNDAEVVGQNNDLFEQLAAGMNDATETYL